MNDLNFAIEMELDGEKYYRQQAENNKNNSLYTVCLMLAEDEENHAQILRNTLERAVFHFAETKILSNAKNVFDGIADIKVEGKENISQLDFYRIASEKENQSIELYTKYLGNVEDAKEKELFEYLIKQEEQHLLVLEELEALLRNAEEWVENAEFGIRKEY